MNRNCPYCPISKPTVVPSIYALHLHQALFHSRYENGQFVEGKTLRLLEKVGARTLNLLIKEPETRNPKNWPLWQKYLQFYSPTHILVYDVARKGWMINRPDGVLHAEDFRELFGELETARRRRQDYQKADGLLYHEILGKGKYGASIVKHNCIRPKEKDIILARLKQDAMHDYYSR